MRCQDEHRAISPLPGTNPAGMTEPSTNPDELSAGTGDVIPPRAGYGLQCREIPVNPLTQHHPALLTARLFLGSTSWGMHSTQGTWNMMDFPL